MSPKIYVMTSISKNLVKRTNISTKFIVLNLPTVAGKVAVKKNRCSEEKSLYKTTAYFLQVYAFQNLKSFNLAGLPEQSKQVEVSLDARLSTALF